MIERVTVTTGSRLHFGPLAVRPTTGREFGGIGLMVDEPRCRVTVSRSETDEVIASTESARVAGWLQRYRNATRQAAAGRRIELSESIPRHSGFGSGTQTALAVATGLALLDGEANVASDELARRLGRGRRSAVG
ncbi:MAG: GHMP kinase, partial [Planctomycetota bacterium]